MVIGVELVEEGEPLPDFAGVVRRCAANPVACEDFLNPAAFDLPLEVAPGLVGLELRIDPATIHRDRAMPRWNRPDASRNVLASAGLG